ncbi:MFS transporter [Rhodococcus sp. NPDC003322]
MVTNPSDSSTTLPNTPPDDRAADEGWSLRLGLSLAAIVLVIELLSVSYMMVSTAVPSLSAHFQTTQGAWLLTANSLVGAVVSPLVGKLADMYGKRLMMLACVLLAGAGAVVSAIAPSFALVVAGRALSGLLIPCLFLSYSLIRDVFPKRTIALAVSITTSGLGLISIAAPFLSGWMIDSYGFRGVFWFMAIGLLVLGPAIALTTPESSLRLRTRLDLVGAILLGGGIAGVLVAVSFGPSWGWTNGSTLSYLVGGLVLIGAWYVSARVVREPLIDLRVLGRRPVFLTTLGAGLCYGTTGLFTVIMPMMAMTPAALGLGYGFGVSAEGYAVFQAPIGLMLVIGGLVVGTLVGRDMRPRLLMIASMLITGVFAVLVAFALDNKPLLIVLAALFGFGMGMGFAVIPNLLIEAVPPELQASSASVVGVSQAIFPAVLPVIAFAVMNNSYIAPLSPDVTQGYVFYEETGYQIAFFIVAAVAVLGALIAYLLPRRIEQVSVPDELRSAVHREDGEQVLAPS